MTSVTRNKSVGTRIRHVIDMTGHLNGGVGGGADISASGQIMGGVIDNYLENYAITECLYTRDVTYVIIVALTFDTEA
jgi:hypothetical protein